MNRPLNLFIPIWLFIIGLLLGSALTLPIPTDPAAIKFEKPDCTKSIGMAGYDCRFVLTPKAMKITFMEKKQFDRESGTPAEAFARPTSDPCEIVLPAGYEILFDPARGKALWGYADKSWRAGDDIAHELLHCYIGYWHAGAAALGMAEIRRLMAERQRHHVEGFRFRFPYLSRQPYELLRASPW